MGNNNNNNNSRYLRGCINTESFHAYPTTTGRGNRGALISQLHLGLRRLWGGGSFGAGFAD